MTHTETLRKEFEEQRFRQYDTYNNDFKELDQEDEILSFLEQKVEEARKEEKESKDGAYRERDMLVCALTKVFPAYLARHSDEDKEWENDWRWIVYIDLPTGQVSWHIHDSERDMFNHLRVGENNWDGHNTERKYQRLQALNSLEAARHSEKGKDAEELGRTLHFLKTHGYPKLAKELEESRHSENGVSDAQ